jgi:hypothetical protein
MFSSCAFHNREGKRTDTAKKRWSYMLRERFTRGAFYSIRVALHTE